MKKLKVKAPEAELQTRAHEKTAWLQQRGVDRVLIVYEKTDTACLYPEEPNPKP